MPETHKETPESLILKVYEGTTTEVRFISESLISEDFIF